MFPPPTTRPIWTPSAWTSASSCAVARRVAVSIPKPPWFPLRASPLSLITTRRYLSFAWLGSTSGVVALEPPPGNPRGRAARELGGGALLVVTPRPMARRPGTREPAIRGAGLLIFVALGFGVSCKKSEPEQKTAPSASAAASAAPFKLSSEQEKQVLARVGNRTITLGDYVATLERMDSFERLRYQSPERRRLLLKEMIDVELLAEEARRRGLDKLPETEERLRQALRDELLKEIRKDVPSPNDLPEADVRKYYEENRADFDEPERRRVSHIAVASRAEAVALLEK